MFVSLYVRPSVTLRYCIKTSRCLLYWRAWTNMYKFLATVHRARRLLSSQCRAVCRPSWRHRSVGVTARRDADRRRVGHARCAASTSGRNDVTMNLNECDGTVTLLHCMITVRLSVRNCTLCVCFIQFIQNAQKNGTYSVPANVPPGQTGWKTGRPGENGTGGNPSVEALPRPNIGCLFDVVIVFLHISSIRTKQSSKQRICLYSRSACTSLWKWWTVIKML